jgi:N-methylhydantoinase B
MFELQAPHILLKHEFATDSAGAGQWRGGLGVETRVKFYGEKTKGVVFGDGVDEEAKAFGLFGGKEGAINEMELSLPDGAIHRPKSKEIIPDLPPGTILHQVAGGEGAMAIPT